MLQEFCEKYSDKIRLTPIQGTYLSWLDCRGMKLSNSALRKFFIEDAKLGLNNGLSFSKEGSGFMRLNFAVSTTKMLEVVKRLDEAFLLKYKK